MGGFWTYTKEDFCEFMEEGKPIVAILGTVNTGHAIVIVNCTLAGSVTSPIYNIQYIDPSDAQIKNCTYTELYETGINGLTYKNTVVME
jgi:predicted nucleic-acid-binding Zn-ribbon protein